ncbi:hypothetical protein NQ315_016054 [Exocentrus adspersus]|uniref:Myb/SANT-like domain-containing protein n=1 Tax=Exocentrus adspersus TaxID=1586481 RepID=A0AAV8VLS6_9CUCU|nr:hypothetical protein NQ315_016054 [Exocentrus adspersus]
METVLTILGGNPFKNIVLYSFVWLTENVKVREAHWQVLYEEMDKNAVLATGKFVGPKGRENYKKLWDGAAKKLNSLGYGVKSTDKWQKGEHFIRFCEPECGLPPQNEEPLPGPSGLQRSKLPTEEDDVPYIRHSASPSPLQQQAQPETVKRRRPLTESSRRREDIDYLTEYKDTIRELRDIKSIVRRGLDGMSTAIGQLTEEIRLLDNNLIQIFCLKSRLDRCICYV